MDIFLDVDVNSPYDENEESFVSFYSSRDRDVTYILRLTRVSQKSYVLEFAESYDLDKEIAQNEDDELEI